MTDVDPEKLLAEALRAKAARTPLPEPVDVEIPAIGHGLLSGSDLGLTLREPEQPTEVLTPRRRVSTWWVLLLAAVLGLAAGAVIGLVTLL